MTVSAPATYDSLFDFLRKMEAKVSAEATIDQLELLELADLYELFQINAGEFNPVNNAVLEATPEPVATTTTDMISFIRSQIAELDKAVVDDLLDQNGGEEDYGF